MIVITVHMLLCKNIPVRQQWSVRRNSFWACCPRVIPEPGKSSARSVCKTTEHNLTGEDLMLTATGFPQHSKGYR